MATEQIYGLELISRSLRLLGVLGLGQTAAGDQATQGLAKLKALEDMLRLDRLTMSWVQRSVQYLSANQSSYTIGVGGNWSMDYPIFIEGAAILPDSSDREIPVKVLTDQEYREFTNKGQSSALPLQGIYFDRQSDSIGLGRVVFVEKPTAVVRIALYIPVSNVNIQNLAVTLYYLPPGYSLMLEYNLARLLKDNYPGTWTQQLEQSALEFLGNVKRVNEQPGVLKGQPLFVPRRWGTNNDILWGE